MHTRPVGTVLLALLALVPSAAAQEAEEPEGEPERWEAEVGLAFTSSGGNEDLTVLTTEAGISRLETSVYELAVNSRFRYGRSDGRDVAQDLHGSINLDLWPEARWSPFLFATGEKDPFRKLDVRFNGGAGLKHTFWSSDRDEVSLSGAVLYSYENLEVADSLGDGITRVALLSWRARARRELSEGSRVEQVVFYQPAWNELDDYLVESRTSARLAFSEQLAFTATALYKRDSTPAPDVEPDDWSIAVGLSLATKW
jgi:hypothetical protein